MSAAEARISVAQIFPDSRETVEKIAAANARARPTRASRNLNQMSTASRRRISCTRAKRAPSEEVFTCSESLIVGRKPEPSSPDEGKQSAPLATGRFRNQFGRKLLGSFVGCGDHFDGDIFSGTVFELNLLSAVLPSPKEFGIANVVFRVFEGERGVFTGDEATQTEMSLRVALVLSEHVEPFAAFAVGGGDYRGISD